MRESEQRVKSKEEAAAWLLRLEEEDVPRAEREAFVEWLRESPLHVAEMLRMTNVHDGLEAFEGWGEVDGRVAGATAREWRRDVIALHDFLPPAAHRQGRRALRPILGVLTVCLIIAGIGAVVFLRGPGNDVIRTAHGERRAVTLADGSELQIDPDTEIHVRFDKHAREIELDRGRALFRVAQDAGKPFLVRAEQTVVRALGTSFGVELRKSGVRITVSEGRVAVTGVDAPSASNGTPTPATGAASVRNDSTAKYRHRADTQQEKNELLLGANQQVNVSEAGSAEGVRPVDSERELAWAHGQLVFEKQTVSAVVDDFNRYNQVQLRITDVALGQKIVSGVFDAADPESFIAFLKATAGVRVARTHVGTIDLSSSE